MPSYSSISTEDLGDDQKRYVNAYEIVGVGCVVNVQVVLTIKAPYQPDTHQAIVDEEVFIPNIKLTDLTNLGFTDVTVLDLDKGQKRIVRQMLIPATGGRVLSVVGTAEFKQGSKTKTIVRSEEVTYAPGVASSPGVVFKPPQGTWVGDTAVDFASRPGQPSKNEMMLPDGRVRYFSGTLEWRHSNLVLDLGWDEEDSYQGGDKWIWWYVVPKTNDNSQLTIVASDNPPSIGPAGRSQFKVCWVNYRLSGDFLKVRQTGNRFDHAYRDVYTDFNISPELSYSSFSLNNFVPETASLARLYQRCIIYATQVDQDRWYCRICGSANDSDLLGFIDVRSMWDTQRSPMEVTQVPQHYIPSHVVPGHTVTALPSTHASHTIPATDFPATTIVYRLAAPGYYTHCVTDHFKAPLFGSRTLYKKRSRVAGTQNDLYFNGIQAYGWVDEWIDP